MIIIVAIGLIILVIAILLVGRSGRSLSEGATNECTTQGGVCKLIGQQLPSEEAIRGVQCFTAGAPDPGKACYRFNFGGQ
jgi:hypothetical protein